MLFLLFLLTVDDEMSGSGIIDPGKYIARKQKRTMCEVGYIPHIRGSLTGRLQPTRRPQRAFRGGRKLRESNAII